MKSINNNLYFLKTLFKVCPQKIIIEILLSVFQSFCDFFNGIYIYKILIDLIQKNNNFKMYVSIILIILVVNLIRGFLVEFYNRYYKKVLSLKVSNRLSDFIHRKQSQIPFSYYETPDYYNCLSRANSCITSMPEKVLNNTSGLIGFMVTGVLTLSFVVSIDKLGVLFIFFPIIYSGLNNQLNKLRYERSRELDKPSRELDYIKSTVFSKETANDLKTTNILNVFNEHVSKQSDTVISVYKKTGFKICALSFLVTFFGTYMPLIAACILGVVRFVVLENINIAQLAALITALNTFCNRLNRTGMFFNQAKDNSLYIQDFISFMNYENENECGVECPEFNTLRINNLSFAYANGKNVLKNINLTINKGEKIAIVGLNGSGKTTLAKLILNLYQNYNGEILYNDISIKQYSVADYRKKFGVVFQDYAIYAASVSENVLLDNYNESNRSKILNALDKSGLLEKVTSFETKEDTNLTKEFDDNGKVLSGGENQKLAISRLFAKDYDIAILDEPSSNLDPIAEKEFYDTVLKATNNKTVIYVSHNLSSAVLAEKIVVMEKGEIKEFGSHNDLMRKNGYYHDLFKLQADNYKD